MKTQEIPAIPAPQSPSRKKAERRASRYLKQPGRLKRLLEKAKNKATTAGGALGKGRDFLFSAIRLLRAYATGNYRDVEFRSLLLILSAVIYFLMPVDAIPDFILGSGFIDDAALLGWTFTAVRHEMDKFADWESLQTESAPEDLDHNPPRLT